MARFYLPIKIADRRMHICHLDEAPLYNIAEFVVPISGNDVTLFSIDNIQLPGGKGLFSERSRTVRPKMVSGTHTHEDEMLGDLGYTVLKEEAGPGELKITVTFRRMPGDNKPLEHDESRIVVKRDPKTEDFVARTTNQTKVGKINFVLVYERKDHPPYSYSFIIHLPKADASTDIYKVAIDFGSEASQIGYKRLGDGTTYNIHIVDVLKSFYGQYNGKTKFWQGDFQDQDQEKQRLYRSFFFVNRNPTKGFQYPDKPNQHERHTLLQTLTPFDDTVSEADDASEFSYRGLTLLPNLKLIELLGNANFRDDEINFGDNENNNGRKYSGQVSVLSIPEVYIRLILNNFIYTILKRINTTPAQKYLQVTLLMPNVYSQKKVYDLIDKLYEDFAAIRDSDPAYQRFRGLEVQALSESDASFIGARNFTGAADSRIAHMEDASYLVIDAGKGTTDFSIIHQMGEDHSKYESVFRAGLPGSGQYLTHAFITAFDQFLGDSLGTNHLSVEKIIYEADNVGHIRDFMEHMETLKIRHTEYFDLTDVEKDTCVRSITSSFQGIAPENFNGWLNQINRTLRSEFIVRGKRIPGSDKIITDQIVSFVDQIDKCIQWSRTTTFYQVVLAGRAFQFAPFREAIKARLAGRVMGNPGFIFHERNQSKFICVEGAFKSEFVSINLNSELIGCPVVIYKNVGNKAKAAGEEGVPIVINEQFFYEGAPIKELEGRGIAIGAREYEIHLKARKGSKKNFNLFYTGDGFIVRWDKDAISLSEPKPSQDLNAMVEATLFPFAKRSLDRRSNGGPRSNNQGNNGTNRPGGPTPGDEGARSGEEDELA